MELLIVVPPTNTSDVSEMSIDKPRLVASWEYRPSTTFVGPSTSINSVNTLCYDLLTGYSIWLKLLGPDGCYIYSSEEFFGMAITNMAYQKAINLTDIHGNKEWVFDIEVQRAKIAYLVNIAALIRNAYTVDKNSFELAFMNYIRDYTKGYSGSELTDKENSEAHKFIEGVMKDIGDIADIFKMSEFREVWDTYDRKSNPPGHRLRKTQFCPRVEQDDEPAGERRE